MKRTIVTILIVCLLLVGCDSTNYPKKLPDDVKNSINEDWVKLADPDLYDIKSLYDNEKTFEVFNDNMMDCIYVVGTVTDTKIEEVYDGVYAIEIYLDNYEKPINGISVENKIPFKVGHSYYMCIYRSEHNLNYFYMFSIEQ